MPEHPSLLEELRVQYESARALPHVPADVPGYQEIDAQLRKAYRWLEKAIAYLDGIRPTIARRFDLGHGIAFASPRFQSGFVGHHEQRIVGFPVLDEINVSYQIVAAPLTPIEITSESLALVEQQLEAAGLHYTARRVEDHAGVLRKGIITVPHEIPAGISFRADYGTGVVQISLINVDRFDRVSLEFQSGSIDESALEDLVRLVLGRSDAFLHRAPLVGIHGKPSG